MGIEVSSGDRPKFKPGLRTFRYILRMLGSAMRKNLDTKKVDAFLKTQKWKYDYYASTKIDKLSARETLHFIEQLSQTNVEAYYFVATSELLSNFYYMWLKRNLAKKRIDIQNISFIEEKKLLKDIDPYYHLSWLHGQYEGLSKEVKRKINTMHYDKLSRASEFIDFKSKIEQFLSRYGHLGDSGNDFSQPPWKETPDRVLRMIIEYQSLESDLGHEIEGDTGDFSRNAFVRYLYNKTVKYRVCHRRIDFIYTYGHGLFRSYFMHLAKLFKGKGYIKREPDIFYLTFDEVKSIVSSGTMAKECLANLVRRRREVAKCKDIDPPGLLIEEPSLPLMVKGQELTRLKGLAVSRGYGEGRVMVIKGSQDFAGIKKGDVIVIPYSDASWMPVLLKAKAIVSESGGMLSHCSVVAREHNIPAVVSVPDALKLKDGTRVVVDGYGGDILIMKKHVRRRKTSVS